MPTSDDRDETCPRCGQSFGCRAKVIESCSCAGVALSAAERACVSARFAGCLCSGCLRAIQIEARRCAP
ncbi:MAG: cysteine-rich CWC family protein [Gammaproteobacteria bacterium]